jgi:hypothetical protein
VDIAILSLPADTKSHGKPELKAWLAPPFLFRSMHEPNASDQTPGRRDLSEEFYFPFSPFLFRRVRDGVLPLARRDQCRLPLFTLPRSNLSAALPAFLELTTSLMPVIMAVLHIIVSGLLDYDPRTRHIGHDWR